MVKNYTKPVRLSIPRVSCNTPSLVDGLLDSLDTKLARQVRVAFKTGDHGFVVGLEIKPQNYTSLELFHRDWLAANILSKYPCLNLGINTEIEAHKAFDAAEQQCKITNKRLNSKYDTPTLGVSGESLIMRARSKIQRLLGPFCWDNTVPFQGFSGGASTRLKRSQGDAYYKFRGRPDVTRKAALISSCVIRSVPSWHEAIRERCGEDPSNWFNIVEGSRMSTVPKNAKTDRCVLIEPCMNMFLQKGLGGLIRSRLKRVGIDLNSQTRNQELARVGSLEDSLATIDLKAASDTISYAIVERLMPTDWFEALDLVRCSHGLMPNGTHTEFHKFSSMGNGFTFELESLIFWALSSAVVDDCRDGDIVAVYGDDIIVPKAAAGWLIELFEYCGFTTNEKKSFVAGPFRESCGKHYFHGNDVTPFFIRSPIDSISRLFWLANSVRRWASRLSDGHFSDKRYAGFHRTVVESLPKPFRKMFISEGTGDGGLIGTLAEARPRRIRSMWVGRSVLEGIGSVTKVDDQFAYIRALMYGGVGDQLTSLLVDREKKWCKLIMHKTSQWHEAPIWV